MIISRQVFYAQGCVGKLAALLHAPRARVGEKVIPLLDCREKQIIIQSLRILRIYFIGS